MQLKIKSISKIVQLFILLIIIALIVVWLRFDKSYLAYQEKKVADLKEEVAEIIANDVELDFAVELVELTNDYAYEIIVQRDNTVVYSSNDLTIDRAEKTYRQNFIYKEVYIEGDYLIWLVVLNVDIVPLINQQLLVTLILTVIAFSSIVVFQLYLARVISKPLLKVYAIIKELRSAKVETEHSKEKLDTVSRELLLLLSDMNLRSYQSMQIKEEYQRIATKQRTLLEEQKKYLETVLHDMKTPLAAINYTRFIIENEKEFNSQVSRALNNLKKQSEGMLDLVVETLNNVTSDSQEAFVTMEEINVNNLIENHFKKNELSLQHRNLTYEISGEQVVVYVNKLKVIQLFNNILNNMIMHTKSEGKLEIEITKDYIMFFNYIGNENSKYSNHYGYQRIMELIHDLGFQIHKTETPTTYQLKLMLRGGI